MAIRKLISKYKTFTMIFIIAFFVYCSNQMVSATISKFASYMGATSSVIGTVSGSFAMVALLMRPFSGQAVDNLNKKRLLSISMGIILVSTMGLMLSSEVYHLIAFRGLNGFGWGIGSTLCMTIATSTFPKEKMTTGIGIYSMGQTIAQAIAPSVALTILTVYSYRNLYLYNVILMTIALVLSFFIKIDEGEKRKDHFKFSFSLSKMVAVPAIMPAGLVLCDNLASSSISAFLVLYAESIGIMNVGFYFTIQAITLLVCRPVISWLADRFGVNKVLIPCELLMMIALLILFSATGTMSFVIAALVMGCAIAGVKPTTMSLCINSVPASQRGVASNTSYIGTDLGVFLGSNFAGVVVGLVGYRKMYLISIIPIGVCLLIYLFYIRKNTELVQQKEYIKGGNNI